jgi:sarcosine oxidase subunit alpha
VSSVAFSYNGRTVAARPGDTVASALYRSGVRIFSRSFKYHRPRGLLCAAGRCPNCLMNVDGVPNVRACTTPVRPGMKVRHQNAFPSPEFDLLAAAQSFGWLMPVGFYYKTFTRRFVWKLVRPVIRRVAGLGVVPPEPAAADPHAYEHVARHTDVAVVGAGPAGISAAIEAANAGANVTLIEEQSEVGGCLRIEKSGAERLAELRGQLAAAGKIDLLTATRCFGHYEGGLLGLLQGILQVQRLIHLRARRLVVATGSYEVPLVFENNDRPGVMLSSAVRRLLHLHGLDLGRSAIIVGEEPDVGTIGQELRAAGVAVAATVAPADVVTVVGGRGVRALRTRQGEIACDLVVVCGPQVPDAALIAQAGGKLEWDAARRMFVPTQLPPGVYAAGRVLGTQALDQIIAQGREAGRRAAAHEEAADVPPPNVPAPPDFLPRAEAGKAFVCLCEDVTVKDLRDAVTEGFDHIETLKRYTTVTMGPCQGKMCQLASIGICAALTGRTMGRTGTTTARPPTSPIPLGALAGARHRPVKRTPMHHRHEALGCVWTDLGEWKRPLYYSTAETRQACIEEEYRAVRERVGIIDVSTLGKLDVQGRDAPKLLDKTYTNRLSDLKVGRVRYGVMVDDEGIILDDGTVSRLSEDRYFITTTTGNIDFVQQWLQWWTIGTGWCAHVTPVTGGFAAVNVAGPKARALLTKLTNCDLDSKSFPYMACRHADVAGVPCFLMRIGFVGETGWEIHVRADDGAHLWDALLEAGREFDVRPFGVETQRLLRLEKKHVIVGVDTDATSNPIGADMAWVVKADKEDFIGKAALARAQAKPPREKLVGFIMEESALPEDGAAIAEDGRPVGRVTSARYSPVNGTAVGLGWVPAEMAAPGREIRVFVRGAFARAKILADPFYDPEGKKLRS